LCLQGSSASVEKFSVRGDGLMTATTAEAGVSAVVAHATHATYAGTVMEVQTTGTAAGSGFKLFHVGGERGVGVSGRGGGGGGVVVGVGVVGGWFSARCLGESFGADCV
jgi:hypothetical protein